MVRLSLFRLCARKEDCECWCEFFLRALVRLYAHLDGWVVIFEACEALTPELMGADVALSDGFSICEVHACYDGEVVDRVAEGWECCCACADSNVDKALS